MPLTETLLVSLTVRAARKLCGEYFFFVFALRTQALEKRMMLAPILVSVKTGQIVSELSEHFLKLLYAASDPDPAAVGPHDSSQFSQARDLALAAAAEQRDQLEADLKRTNQALVAARLGAIKQAYQVKNERLRLDWKQQQAQKLGGCFRIN